MPRLLIAVSVIIPGRGYSPSLVLDPLKMSQGAMQTFTHYGVSLTSHAFQPWSQDPTGSEEMNCRIPRLSNARLAASRLKSARGLSMQSFTDLHVPPEKHRSEPEQRQRSGKHPSQAEERRDWERPQRT